MDSKSKIHTRINGKVAQGLWPEDGPIGLSPLHPSETNDLHTSVSHQSLG